MKALNQLKRHLGALEKNYLTAREKHRNLQLQNYKDNVGEFDPERLEDKCLVHQYIFRILSVLQLLLHLYIRIFLKWKRYVHVISGKLAAIWPKFGLYTS